MQATTELSISTELAQEMKLALLERCHTLREEVNDPRKSPVVREIAQRQLDRTMRAHHELSIALGEY